MAELAVDHLQQREGQWAIANLSGKGGHVRTVPVPDWVYCELSTWMEAAGINGGRVFRRVSSAGKSWAGSPRSLPGMLSSALGKSDPRLLPNTDPGSLWLSLEGQVTLLQMAIAEG